MCAGWMCAARSCNCYAPTRDNDRAGTHNVGGDAWPDTARVDAPNRIWERGFPFALRGAL